MSAQDANVGSKLTGNAAGDAPLPLTGIRVLDLGHVFQGPYATFLMAMAGAEVIKVESPQGDMARRKGKPENYCFAALNGCKRGVVLNLKTQRGRDLLLDLAASADVLVENFTPQVMAGLGLGPRDFWKTNPRLIYASGSGFGHSGPAAQKLAFDLTIQAASGLMSTTGEIGGRPIKAGIPVADFMAGAHLYGAVVTALFERERTGSGRVVEVSMLEAMVPALLPAIGFAYENGGAPPRTGNRHLAASYAPFDTFETKDGWIAIVCGTDQQWTNLTRAMSRPDLADNIGLSQVSGRLARIDAVAAAIGAWTITRTRDEISALCEQHRVPAAPVQDVMEVLADPHLQARGFLSAGSTAHGSRQLPNSPMRYGGSSQRPLTAPPALGAHTRDVLAELCDLDAETLIRLRHDGVIDYPPG